MTSQFQTETILFDEDLHDLANLRRERDLLMRVAHMFERFAGKCQGECRVPVHIGHCEITDENITCCDLRASFERYCQLNLLEARLETKIQAR